MFGKKDNQELSNHYAQPEKPKKKLPVKNIIIGVIVLFILIGVLSQCGGNGGKSTSSSPSSSSPSTAAAVASSKAVSSKAASLQPYSATLGAGNYTVGIDIPAGKYNLTAQSGYGNVNSSNMYSGGLNEIMGTEQSAQKTFTGAKFDKDVTLSISGSLTLQISSDAADVQNLTTRKNTATKEYTFSSGNYTCGTDFEPGEYVITAASGYGNVNSDNMYDGGLNEVMGTTNGGLSQFSNAEFKDGAKLTVSGGVTIKISPSK